MLTMVLLKQFDAELLVCSNEKFIVYNTENSSTKVVQIPDIKPEVLEKHGQRNENRTISSVCYSRSGEYFAVAAGKQIFVYQRNLSVINTFILQRSTSKIRFTNGNDILVADKTGDAYLCRASDNKNDVELLLGHLSMLLDILLTDDNKFVVTCDRDEKIRVSCYPNCYNIMSYCLGHREFVTNIEVFNNCLISASGDGEIRFWNFLTGEQIDIINTNIFIEDKCLIDDFCKKMDEEKCEVSSLPIVDMQIFQTNTCYLAVSLHNYKSIQIYTLQALDKNLKCVFHSNVALDRVPICFSLTQNLYILTEEALVLYCLKENQYVRNDSEELNNFYNKHKEFFSQSDCTSISVLYKRKFDNVQEYLNRKKQRLEAKIKN